MIHDHSESTASSQAEQIMELTQRMKKLRVYQVITEVNHSEAMFLHQLVQCSGKKEPVPLQTITAHMHMQPAAVSRLMKQMESEGLIQRSTDPDNRRNTLVQATDLGLEKAELCHRQVTDFWNKIFGNISKEDWKQLIRILTEMTDTMETTLKEYKK